MSIKLLNPAHEKTYGLRRVKSARGAAEVLGLAHNTFFKALAAEWIVAQAHIEGDRPAFGFADEYLAEVDKVLPKREDRIKGRLIFTEDVRASLDVINKKWDPDKKKKRK